MEVGRDQRGRGCGRGYKGQNSGGQNARMNALEMNDPRRTAVFRK